MSLTIFGPGQLYVTRSDIANQTPYNIGYINEFSYDESGDTKQLFGQNQYPLAAARSTIKATGKMKAAQVSGLALNAVFHGLSFSAGSLALSASEAHSVPASTPWQVTITPPSSGTFNSDLGVLYANTGLPFIKVATVSAAGQYSVNTSTGVYTFGTADASAAVLISYAYTTTATTAQTKTISNQPIGTSPTFQIDYATTYNAQQYYIRFFQCISSKLSSQFKLSDFMMPEVDFEFFANAAGNVYEVSYPNLS